MLDWDPPRGRGSEAIVDAYMIYISPLNMLVPSSPWNVTLAHNEVYTINLTAINCAGESQPAMITNIEISK